MASSITATTTSIAHARTLLLLQHKRPLTVSSSPLVGLPSISGNKGRVRCCSVEEVKSNNNVEMGSCLAAAAAAAMTLVCNNPAAMALVDDRMSTEGTGLPFGLSNNLLGWILFGVFGLIWTFYTVYTSSLDEDEESGLSL